MRAEARVDGKIELQISEGQIIHVLKIDEVKELISELNKAWNKAEAYLESECKCEYMPGRNATGEQPCTNKDLTMGYCPYTTDGGRRFCPEFRLK